MEDSVCKDCKWYYMEEITDGYYVPSCEEDSQNFLTCDGCWHYEMSDPYEGEPDV